MINRISEHLYKIDDTCSTYAIVKDASVLLIDCGGHVTPEVITSAGLPNVEQILLTHFHRDQCAGVASFKGNGVTVILPFAERRFFEGSDILKAAYDTYDNYTSYYPTFGPLDDIIPDQYAFDYGTIVWKDISFQVVPLPGHTFGSVGYVFECDGRRMLACGDLMSSPGKMHEYFWTQWQYMDFKGHVNHMDSLKTAASLPVDMILPGHGDPFEVTAEAFADLLRPMEEIYELFHGKSYQYFTPIFRRITDHVVEVSNATAYTYIIHDDEGHAVMIDSGYVNNGLIAANPHRYIDNLTPFLEPELGIHTVEWFLPTHYHDDHLAGYHALYLKYGTKVVSSPELKDILEHPDRYDMPCLVPIPMSVSHIVSRGDAFAWRGIEFYIEQHPGQTWYHHLIRFEVDGKRFLSIGDNISGMSFREKRDHIHSFIPKNRTPVTSYTDMPKQILDADPDYLMTGHGGVVVHDRGQTERWQTWMDRWQELFTGIIDQPQPNLGMDPHWVEFYPYKIRVKPGDAVKFTVTITNHESEKKQCNLRFRSIEGVDLNPGRIDIEVPGNDKASCEVEANFPLVFNTHALPIHADVIWDGRSLGEIAEAIAYW